MKCLQIDFNFFLRGFNTGWVLGRLTGCEEDFACLVRSAKGKLFLQYKAVQFKPFFLPVKNS